MLREALTSERLATMAPGEASAYFVARSLDGLSTNERDLLDAWLAADQAHVRAFESARRGWQSFDDSGGDEILAAMREHALSARPQSWLSRRYIPIAAAMLVLVVAMSVAVSPLRRALTGTGAGEGGLVWTQYASAYGEVHSFALADGSVMTLDTDSVARVRFTPGGRAIQLLKGRGLFEVAKDAARPFAVTAASRRVVALGTRFEVDRSHDGLSVTLFRGKVAVQPLVAGVQTIVLAPGQRFLDEGGAVRVEAIGVKSDDKPAWQNGLLEFDDTPLGEAAGEVDRYARTRIIITDPVVSAIRVTGQFRATDAERFASTITEVYPVRMIRRENRIELVRAN